MTERGKDLDRAGRSTAQARQDMVEADLQIAGAQEYGAENGSRA